jgi:hypothetical protein
MNHRTLWYKSRLTDRKIPDYTPGLPKGSDFADVVVLLEGGDVDD